MELICKNCNVLLNENNRAKNRRLCKDCRCKTVMEYQRKDPEKRRAYINNYVRSIGKVRQYECLTCKTLCYKKYSKAFCSDKCRFLFYVKKTDSCWLWIGTKNKRGYGKICFRSNKSSPTHRVSYVLFKGEIAENMLVCHSCDNPSCVRPDHLWLGTAQDNKIDQRLKDRIGLKLKTKDVLNIRKLYDSGIGSATIAKLFDVSCSTISNIAKKRSWKHI